VKRKRGENVLSAYDGGSGDGHRPQSGGSCHSFWQVRNYILAFFAAAHERDRPAPLDRHKSCITG